MTSANGSPSPGRLRVRCLDLDTRERPIAVLRKDSPLCRSEGFTSHARIRLESAHDDVIAELFQTGSELLAMDEIGLSTAAWEKLQVRDGDHLHASHPRPLRSVRHVRGKVYGRRFSAEALKSVMRDIERGRYDEIELAMFLTAIAARALDDDELVALTGAMVEVGERLEWAQPVLMDKHCVGGLPGNRTTPLVVAIVAANGLIIPKTSSRAITSPAGTADTMEMLAPVNLDLGCMRRVVEAEGGCVVWGGSVRLSPVDDMLIRIARVMDLDAEAQLVASVLSKKIAAGATHLVLDLPVGETAKVRSRSEADTLGKRLAATAGAFGLSTRTIVTDGRQPVGRGIGPALEAYDVLAVLQGEEHQPSDLRERAVALAAELLEMGGASEAGRGRARAEETLQSGAAWRKFKAICEAQGGLRTPPVARCRDVVTATHGGVVANFDNRRLGRVAKLAGAPAPRRRRRPAWSCTCIWVIGWRPAIRSTPSMPKRAASWNMRTSSPATMAISSAWSRKHEEAVMNAVRVIALPGDEALGAALAAAQGFETAELEYRRFPDGESYLRLRHSLAGEDIVLVARLDRPDPKIPALLFAADLVRDLGAAGVGLVAPYLPYMRQDARFHPGEALTSASFARWVSGGFDWLITVDPHLHRYASLDEIYAIPSAVVPAAPALAEWIVTHVQRPVLIGPDAESAQWVEAVAAHGNLPWRVMRKKRLGDHDVRIAAPDLGGLQRHTPVVVDDIVSSGATLARAAGLLSEAGMATPVCAVVHGLFGQRSRPTLAAAGIGHVVCTDSIRVDEGVIELAPLLAPAVSDMLKNMPASGLSSTGQVDQAGR